MEMQGMDRRTLLTSIGSATAAGLAGCSSTGEDAAGKPTDKPTTTPTETATATPEPSPTPSPEPTPSPTPSPTPGPSIDLDGEDTGPGDPYTTLHVAYNYTLASEVLRSENATQSYQANPGFSLVCVQFELENAGERDLQVGPGAFLIETAGGTQREYLPLNGLPSPLSGVTLPPDGTAEGWVVFQIASDTESASLLFNQSIYRADVAAEFRRDDGLEFPYPTV